MKSYYKNYSDAIGSGKWRSDVYFGFSKNNVNVQELRTLLKEKTFDNRVVITENLIVFFQDLMSNDGNKKKSKHIFQKARMLKNVIVFGIMSYANYKATHTAREIIIQNSVNEKQFDSENFVSVHEGKLSVEKLQKQFDISLELENINIPVEKMEDERNKEIEKRIYDILQK